MVIVILYVQRTGKFAKQYVLMCPWLAAHKPCHERVTFHPIIEILLAGMRQRDPLSAANSA
jgi:hypothetical protein